MSCYFQKGTILRFEKAGPFRIQEIIGVGASSVVYRAINTEDHTEHLLKEFHPSDLSLSRDHAGNLILLGDECEKRFFDFKLDQFRLGYNRQIELRKDPVLKNRTCNISGIYSGYGTEFIDMTTYSGATYDKVTESSFSNLIKRVKAIAEVVSRYHALDYLHLDIKPENIFVFDDTCESVVFFDFDTIVSKTELQPDMVPRYSSKYAPKEQSDPDAYRLIGEWTDIYAIGMILFQKLFGRFPDSHEQESNSSYDFRLPSGILNDANDKTLELLTDFFRHTICKRKQLRWKSTKEVIRALNQMLDAMQPTHKTTQDNEDIKNVGKQISTLSKVILISAVLICISIGFLALRRTDSDPENVIHAAVRETVQEEALIHPETEPLIQETFPVSKNGDAQNAYQTEPTIMPIIAETDPIEIVTAPSSQESNSASYVVETVASNMNGFRSMIVTNSGVVYYLDGSLLHATDTDVILDLQSDFDVSLENGYLAYDPYQDMVYLLTGGSLTIHDVTDLNKPLLVLENDSLTLDLETGITPNISVLPDSSLIIPANEDGSYKVVLSSNTYTYFTHIYDLSSPYYIAVTSDSIFMFREGETDATVTALSSSGETVVTLGQPAPYNEAVASSGSKLWFYADGIGVCAYAVDGSVYVQIPQRNISITDYLPLDYNNIWSIAANDSGEVAFYDNSLSSIRFIHYSK